MVDQTRDYVGEELERVIIERDELREAYHNSLKREQLLAELVQQLEERVELLETHKKALRSLL